MAHNSTITSGGIQFEVTEFDHTAQEIDDSVDRSLELENKTVELEKTTVELEETTVKKTGDTMTGELTVHTNYGIKLKSGTATTGEDAVIQQNSGALTLWLRPEGISDNSLRLSISPGLGVFKALKFTQRIDRIDSDFFVFHTGNKPSGEYTGNGDATERTIETGGIGNVIIIHNSNGLAIVTPNGGILEYGINVGSVAASVANYSNGKLVLKTTNSVLNGMHFTTYYTCL